MSDIRYTFNLQHYEGHLNMVDDNIDFEIVIDGDERYLGTFFTVQNITTLMNKWRKSGESLHGLYFCVANPVIVQSLNSDVLSRVIYDIVKNKSYLWCLQKAE